MFRIFISAIIVFVALTTTPARAGDLVKKKSPHSVAVTLDRLEAALKKKGVLVFARIDHAGGAAGIGQSLKPMEVLIFGHPRMGTPLIQASPTIGIDLPARALAWQDAQGQVWLAYYAPEYLKTQHHTAGRDKVFAKMTGALDNFTNAAVAP